ncbi:MAG: tetratricopeptide repeat protein [Armatimonadota bacterium]|jgi:hypothetical protein
MYCPDCGRRNPEPAQFCSECGTPFGGERPDARAPLMEPHELVRQASELKDLGQLEGAIELCRRAILAEPRHRGAHALLGLLYERKGQTPSAIREYRVVLEIDPNSTAEREKLSMLEGDGAGDAGLMAEAGARWAGRPWRVATLGAMAAVVVLLVFGGIALLNRGRPGRGPDEMAMSRPGASPGGVTAPGTDAARVAQPRTTRPPYPAMARSASPFQGGRMPRTAVPRGLPSVASGTVPGRTRTPRTTPGVTPPTGGLPTARAEIPPLVLGRTVEPTAATGRPVVTPTREGPLDVRPAREEPVTPGGPVEVVREGDTEEAPATGHIEIWPSVGVRARMPGPTTPPAEGPPAPGPTAAASGRTHQIQAGQLRQQGQYAEAIQRYEAAISAYTSSVQEGLAGAQATKGIESCRHAIAACQASLAER